MSLIQIGEIVDCLNIQFVTLLLPQTGTYNDRGQFVETGADTVLDNQSADVQPASGRVLHLVSEGERTTEHVQAFFTQVVDTTSEALATKAARMIYRGFIWKVVAVPGDWRENGYMQCLLQNTKVVYVP